MSSGSFGGMTVPLTWSRERKKEANLFYGVVSILSSNFNFLLSFVTLQSEVRVSKYSSSKPNGM